MNNVVIVHILPAELHESIDSWWSQFPTMLGARTAAWGCSTIRMHCGGIAGGAAAGLADVAARYPHVFEGLCDLRWCRDLAKGLLKSHARVLIHTHGPPLISPLGLVARASRGRIKWLVTDHIPVDQAGEHGLLHRLHTRLRYAAGFMPHAIISVSRSMSAKVRARYPGVLNTWIHNGIRLDTFVDAGASRAVDDPFKILFVGKLRRDKGVHVLIDAVHLLTKKELPVRLTIMGLGPEWGNLEKQVERCGLVGSVVFSGFKENPRRFYAQHDLCVVPSVWDEPFGLVSIEAQSVGCPVICSDAGGLSETVDPGKTGLLVPRNSPEALMQAMADLYRNRERRAELGRNGPGWVRDRFSMERMVTEYEAVYKILFARWWGV